MMNPHWPYLPQRQENYETEMEREAIEGVWNTISDDPLNYHFYYHILDGDEGGRPPKIGLQMDTSRWKTDILTTRIILVYMQLPRATTE